jgi:hypothetical protein
MLFAQSGFFLLSMRYFSLYSSHLQNQCSEYNAQEGSNYYLGYGVAAEDYAGPADQDNQEVGGQHNEAVEDGEDSCGAGQGRCVNTDLPPEGGDGHDDAAHACEEEQCFKVLGSVGEQQDEQANDG